MRLLISGGGTGGHLFPALAVAQAFRAEEPRGEVLLVGRAGGPEEQVVPEAGFPLETVTVRGFDRDAPWKNAVLPVLLPAALGRAVAIVRRFRPDVILGVGGYVMAPAVAAGRLRRVPYVLHEQNVLPGLATRMFARSASAVCLTFSRTEHYLHGDNLEVTGLPLRAGFARRVPQVPARTLLVVGGSQGARHINQTVWHSLDALLQRFSEVIHVTGAQGAEASERYRRDGYRPVGFTTDMPALMAEADLVVCRAGVGTISEISAVGLPAILVPGTFGGGHQEQNAAVMVEAGAAVEIHDDDLTEDRLLQTIDSLSPEALRVMAQRSAGFGRPDAAERVLAVLRRVSSSAA